jgi:hypothetical protein
MKGTELFDAATNIPHRARISRHIVKPQQGVLMFGKKGNDYVFKILGDNGIKLLSAEDAIGLFAASTQEKAFKVSDSFDSKYQELKHNLFRSETSKNNSDALRDAFKKAKGIYEFNILSKDYLDDLCAAIRNDALSGYEIRYINQLHKKDYAKLPTEITHEYIIRQLDTASKISEGEESLILTEEITSPNN